MFQRTKICTGLLLAFGGGLLATAPGAFAQDSDVQRVEVTGSAIKRIDAETSVPVTVVKMEDLKKAGVTSVEQVMSTLSAVQVQQNAAASIGSSSGGATFADMRGIGADKTLVLLNGQRIANNAVDGSAPDLNMIPFAAIKRIEVLRDGASSLYGTDAIGGVINFITEDNLQGGSINVGYDSPQHPGGKTQSGSLSYGFGDLNKQNFNVFGTFSFRKQNNINGEQRDFNKRIVGGLSNSTFPANYGQDGLLYNPAAPDCDGTAMIAVTGGTQCKLVTPSYVDFSPESKTYSGLLKGTLRVNEDLTLGAEVFASHNEVTTKVAPVPYGGYLINPGTTYYPTNPNLSSTFDDGYAGAPAFNKTTAFPDPVDVLPGYVYVYWRDNVSGPRQQTNKNNQQRVLLTADGFAGGWDYSGVLSYNRNKVDQLLTGGYADGDVIGEGLLEGIINPFGAQTDAGEALIKSAALNGLLQTATGTITTLNVHGSRELGDWFNASRPVQVAIGVEGRHEKFISVPNHDFAAKVAVSTGVDPDFRDAGARNVEAVFGELNVPVLKTLDVTASARFDHYSDFGSTTNPKVSFRFQPTKEVLVRGSASTGFRAPTLYELYSSPSYTNTSGDYNNPNADCTVSPSQCDAQFQVQNGGNAHLKPEKSKSGTLGIVLQPAAKLTLSADFWWVKVNDSIGPIPQSTLFSNYDQYKDYFHFNSAGNLSIISNCPGVNCGYVDQSLQNLGGTQTNGVDLSAQYGLATGIGQFDFTLNSTYVMKYQYQDYKDGPWNQNVGKYSGSGPIFRWQHNLGINWVMGQWSAGVAAHYKSGYLDYDPSNRVKSYATTDIFAGYSPIKALNLVFGVRNLFDQAPPFSNQADLFQSGGWDSRYADPTGRTFYLRGTYNF